jgi:hypothetical protein
VVSQTPVGRRRYTTLDKIGFKLREHFCAITIEDSQLDFPSKIEF